MTQIFARNRTAQHRTEYKKPWFVILFSYFSLIMVSVFCSAVMAQSSGIQIQGTVLDENGETLIGVSVLDRESKKGTVTDLDGKFSLIIPDSKSQLEFTYVGYAKQTIT